MRVRLRGGFTFIQNIHNFKLFGAYRDLCYATIDIHHMPEMYKDIGGTF